MARTKSTFNRLVNPASISALEAEIDEDRSRFNELFDRYGLMRAELQKLSEGIDRQEKVLEALRGAMSTDGDDPPSAVRPGTDNGMTKREMAEEILRESLDPLFPREVRNIAVERGLLSGDHAAGNQLSVAMAKAARAGILSKDDRGRYSVPDQP